MTAHSFTPPCKNQLVTPHPAVRECLLDNRHHIVEHIQTVHSDPNIDIDSSA